MSLKSTMHDRLKAARMSAGFVSATDAIKAHGWKGSTYRAHENGQNQFDPSAARAYAAAFNTTASWLLTGEERIGGGLGFAQLPDERIFVKGRVAGGEWLEERIRVAIPAYESIFPPDSRFPIEAQFDLSVHGESLNRFAQDGDFLRCLDLDLANAKIRDGDLLIVERRTGQGLTEITARRLREAASGPVLSFESDNPCFHDMIALDGDVLVAAKVLWKYRQA